MRRFGKLQALLEEITKAVIKGRSHDRDVYL